VRRKLLPLRSTPSNLAPDPHGAVIACSAPPSSGSSSSARAVGAGGRCVNGSRSRRRCWIRTPGRSTPVPPGYGNASVGSPPVLGHAGQGGQLPGRHYRSKGHRPGEPPDGLAAVPPGDGSATRRADALPICPSGKRHRPTWHMALDTLDDPGGCGVCPLWWSRWRCRSGRAWGWAATRRLSPLPAQAACSTMAASSRAFDL
jgi:hypothetical protein